MGLPRTYAHASLIEICDDGGTEQQHLALALHEIAFAIREAAHDLGIRDASTPMGATEVLGLGIKQAATTIADAIRGRG